MAASLVRSFKQFNLLNKSLVLNELSRFSYLTKRGIKIHVRPTLRALYKRQQEYEPQIPDRRSAFPEWNYNAEIFAFGKRLHEEFRIELLLQAFIHKSYLVDEIRKQHEVGIEDAHVHLQDNEQLAETGEKVISEYVRRYLCHSLPKLPLEGINAIHAYLISSSNLGNIGENLGTKEIILSAEYPAEAETYARTFKAIVGALVESQGVERANLFVRDFVVTKLASTDLGDVFEIQEPLAVLTGILEREGRAPPEPRIINQSAVNTVLATHHVGIYSNKELLGQGPGESIQVAIEIAALNALRRMFNITDAAPTFRFDLEALPTTEANLPLSEWTSTATAAPPKIAATAAAR